MIVEGDVGDYAGRKMSGGRLDIRGDAGAYLASGTNGGVVTVKGSAGDQVGGPAAGDKFGMMGGIVVIEGHAGDRVGDRMRRGTIIVRGRCGAIAGTRMLGGTIWTDQGFGADPGLLMRRGTLIGPDGRKAAADLRRYRQTRPRHPARPVALHSAHARRPGPASLSGNVRKYAGDLATIGKGETADRRLNDRTSRFFCARVTIGGRQRIASARGWRIFPAFEPYMCWSWDAVGQSK